jgi:signal recognition particle receptor subunit beta
VVVVSYSGKEINAKLVYYGAGLSGKTTNLESIYEAVPDTSRGKMVSMKTQSDRTLFFDLLPLDLGEIMGFKTRFLLYTVPGQVFYNATRKLVLKGADAIVFVADSEVGKMEENRESLANLRANLAEYNLSLDDLPWVIQYNKRDIANVYTIEELNAELNPGGKVPFFEAVATQGKGVFETFRGISHLLMEKVTRDLRRSPANAAAATPSPVKETPKPEPQPQRPSVLPTAPGRAIAREAQESVAFEAPAPTGVDYGREISLPDQIPPRAPELVAKAPAPAPQPVAATVSRAAAPPAPLAPGEAPAPRREPAARVAPAPARPEPAPLRAEPAPSRAEAAPSRAEAAPNRAEAAPSRAEAANGRPDAQGAIVVPVKLPKGMTREIVVRIVISNEDE